MDEIGRYFFNLEMMRASLPHLLAGLRVTLEMAALTIVLGVPLGLLLATARTLQWRWLDTLIVVYADVFRAIPALVILMLVYFGLPSVGITVPPFWSAVLTLVLVLGAFAEEIFWAGITAVDKGQWEAARASGLGLGQTLVYVVLAQAFKLVVPTLTNRTIAITKYTAIASAVSVPEILNQASMQQGALANPSPLTLGAIMYVAMFLPFVVASRHLERRFAPIR